MGAKRHIAALSPRTWRGACGARARDILGRAKLDPPGSLLVGKFEVNQKR
ncbi:MULTISPECIES: hypothetical protein [Bradyrhizobium]|nr:MULTISPECIES: hypothetical protein [Bradyrhizobium]